MATENLLAAFLHEIREVTVVQRRFEEQMKARREAVLAEQTRRIEGEADKEKLPDSVTTHPESAASVPESEDAISEDNLETVEEKPEDGRDAGGKCIKVATDSNSNADIFSSMDSRSRSED